MMLWLSNHFLEYVAFLLLSIPSHCWNSLKYDSGNNEPKRGFGHVAVLTNDVYAACEVLEKAGVQFKKKPDEVCVSVFCLFISFP